MTPATREHDALARQWKRLYAPIATELAAAEELLRGELTSDDPFVDQLVKHAFRLGGKRLRPALVLLAAKAAGRVTRDHIVLAAVLEMIHTATLVHDDVLDEASLRRHRETINARNDNEASVLVGDFLFTHSFYLASSLETTYACRAIGHSTNIVCAGELRQIHSRGNFALSEADYLSIIEAKTAELCACCCRLGAHYAGAAPRRRSARTLRPQPGHRLPNRRRHARPGRRRSVDGQEPRHRSRKAKAHAPADSFAGREHARRASRDHRAGHGARCRPAPQLLAWLERGDALEYTRERAQAYAKAAGDDARQLPNSPSTRRPVGADRARRQPPGLTESDGCRPGHPSGRSGRGLTILR